MKITPPEMNPLENIQKTQKRKIPNGRDQQTAGVHFDQFETTHQVLPNVYDKLGQLQGVPKKRETLLDHFKALQETVEQQLNSVFDSISQHSEDKELVGKAHDELKSYFAENPEALQQVAAGEIPEYWNVENTARRMFGIVTAGFNPEMDVEHFYKTAVDFVNQAYSEVRDMIGFDFPSLVTDTKKALLNGLEQLKEGTAIDEISFAPVDDSAE
jgi:hypothetical protein